MKLSRPVGENQHLKKKLQQHSNVSGRRDSLSVTCVNEVDSFMSGWLICRNI